MSSSEILHTVIGDPPYGTEECRCYDDPEAVCAAHPTGIPVPKPMPEPKPRRKRRVKTPDAGFNEELEMAAYHPRMCEFCGGPGNRTEVPYMEGGKGKARVALFCSRCIRKIFRGVAK